MGNPDLRDCGSRVIEFIHVTKEYAQAEPALKDVSFRQPAGQFAFLTGDSGSGKSTTLRLIHLVDRPTEGEVRVGGFSSKHTPPRDVWKLRRQVGYVFQDFRLLPGRTALENVAFALEVTGTARSEIRSRAPRLLAQVGLAPKAASVIHQLSGGSSNGWRSPERSRASRRFCWPTSPRATSTSGRRAGSWSFSCEINALGTAVLMATHDLKLVRGYPSARRLELQRGRLVHDSEQAVPVAGIAD